jgi:hypothetical protein
LTPLELERLLVREVLAEWRRLNAVHFKEALRAPTLELVDQRTHLGRWHHATRTLTLSRPLVLEQPWGVVVEVLKHEMAHQYAHEVLGATEEAPHGAAFRAVCERLGIDAQAAGMPRAQEGPESEDRVVARIAKLLALAESPNPHEAEAAMAAAQRLMLKHNLDQVAVRAPRAYGFRHLGVPTGRTTEAQRILAALLGKHFFVEVIWVPVYRPREGKRGSVLEICGSTENLAMAEYVHAFLEHTAERLWEEHARRTGAPRAERRSYLTGVMAGFAEKLAQGARAQQREGLVWVRDADLSGFYRKRHPYVRHVRYAGGRRTETFAEGKEAGKRIVLHKPVEHAAGSRGNLLPPRR